MLMVIVNSHVRSHPIGSNWDKLEIVIHVSPDPISFCKIRLYDFVRLVGLLK